MFSVGISFIIWAFIAGFGLAKALAALIEFLDR
jgi:hypothetical protein